MKLEELLSVNNIATKIQAQDKYDVIHTLIDLLGDGVNNFGGKDKIFEVVKEREELMSTGVGHGVAIPHGKLDQGDKVLASFCTLSKGIDFNSPDKMPTYLVILLVGPKRETGSHIRAIAHISKVLQDEETREKLNRAQSSEEIFSILNEREQKYFS